MEESVKNFSVASNFAGRQGKKVTKGDGKKSKLKVSNFFLWRLDKIFIVESSKNRSSSAEKKLLREVFDLAAGADQILLAVDAEQSTSTSTPARTSSSSIPGTDSMANTKDEVDILVNEHMQEIRQRLGRLFESLGSVVFEIMDIIEKVN